MLSELYAKHPQGADYCQAYVGHLSKLLAAIDYTVLGKIIDLLLEVRERGNTVYIAGNGGSASTAAHLAQDLIAVGRKTQSAPIKAFSMSANVSQITAIANDLGYDQIYRRQVDELMQPGDLLLTISASGNSPNLVKAVELANEKGYTTAAWLGFSGGKLAELCHHVVHCQTAHGEYGPCEDVHMVFVHMTVHYLMDRLNHG